MYKNLLLTFALLSTTAPLKAMEGSLDEKVKPQRTIARVSEDLPLKVLHKLNKMKNLQGALAMLSNIEGQEETETEISHLILKYFEAIKSHIQSFSDEQKANVFNAMATSYWVLSGNLNHSSQTEESTTIVKNCIWFCELYLATPAANKTSINEVKGMIGHSLKNQATNCLSQGDHQGYYDHIQLAMQKFQETNLPKDAQKVGNMLLSLLNMEACKLPNKEQKRKALTAQLSSLQRITGKTYEKYRIHDAYNPRQLKKGVSPEVTYGLEILGKARAQLKDAQSSEQWEVWRPAIFHYGEALTLFLERYRTSKAQEGKKEALGQALLCFVSIEKIGQSLLKLGSTFDPHNVENLIKIHKGILKDGESVQDGTLIEGIMTYLSLGDLDAATLRCDVLCALEESKGGISERAKFLRMQVKAINGDLEELRVWLDLKKSKNEKQREKNKKKKERLKAKKVEQIQGALAQAVEEKKAEEERKLIETETKTPLVKTIQKEPAFHSSEIEQKVNLKSEYRGQIIKEKVKTHKAGAMTAEPEKKQEVDEKSLVKKVLSSNTFLMVQALLKGNKDINGYSRQDVFKVFADLGCVINEARGKGSHSIIQYVTDNRDGTLLGCIPELEFEGSQEKEESLNNNNNEPHDRNITLPVRKKWDGPMPYYLVKALQGMLQRMGYTLETIEEEKKPQHQNSKKTNNKKKK